jgi:formylglycine-generating enzyme required for sulfatase activity
VTSVIEQRSGIRLDVVDQGDGAPGFYLGRCEVSLAEWNRVLAQAAAPGGEPETHPAAGMSFAAARDFCERTGLRLPTAEEWESAARLAGGRAFPWGDEFQPGACNSSDGGDAFRGAAPVGSFAADRCGPFLDLSGNVQEWCVDAGGKPALRGGSWRLPPAACKLAAKGNPPKEGGVSIGLRVAANSPP